MFESKIVAFANERLAALQAYCDMLKKDYFIQPALAFVTVGDAEAQILEYMDFLKTCGIHVKLIEYDEDVTEEAMLYEFECLSLNTDYHGVFSNKSAPVLKAAIKALSIHKDINGAHPTRLGELLDGNANEGYTNCMAKALMLITQLCLDHKSVPSLAYFGTSSDNTSTVLRQLYENYFNIIMYVSTATIKVPVLCADAVVQLTSKNADELTLVITDADGSCNTIDYDTIKHLTAIIIMEHLLVAIKDAYDLEDKLL